MQQAEFMRVLPNHAQLTTQPPIMITQQQQPTVINWSNIFDEREEGLCERFSSIVFVLFAYFMICYWVIMKNLYKCTHLPDLPYILIIIVLHIAHIFVLKWLFNKQGVSLVLVLAAFGPMILFIIFCKYMENSKKTTATRLQQMLYQMQKQNQPILNQPQDTTPTGMHNAMLKQQQSNNGMVSVPASTLTNSQVATLIDPTMNSTAGEVLPFGNNVGGGFFSNGLSAF